MPRLALYKRLAGAARVIEVSAPAGYGKTSLLRSWIAESGLAEQAAWVTVQPAERSPQRFWLSLLDALRQTTLSPTMLRSVSAAPELDAWALVERLLEDLRSLDHELWLVIDDLHELRSDDALRQLELLLTRSPAELRLVLLTRHDLRLGLHRLRLEGEVSEIRARHLRFSQNESGALFEAAGVHLSDEALSLLHDRTEGWPAGLRLAALSLAGNPDPERLTREFSGSERTLAEYLLAEVLERQPHDVRQLLLRTSIVERVSGPLADALTGGHGGERVLQELEEAGAFVTSLDARRSWFRYHHLFADLLQLELRRSAQEEVTALHDAACQWFAEHGYPIEAIRHAQAAEHWSLAARMLFDQWLALYLDGQATVAHELLIAFPASFIAADPELTVLMAADNLTPGDVEETERHLLRATREFDSVPAGRRGRLQVTLAVLRVQIARQRGDLPAVADAATRLLAVADAPETAWLELGDELRALALINLGAAELWTSRLEAGDRHVAEGIALARRTARPYLELIGLVHQTVSAAALHTYTVTEKRSLEAVALAERHGWEKEPVVGVAYTVLGGTMLGQGRLDDAERWLRHAERALSSGGEPAAAVMLHHMRGVHALASGRHEEALAMFHGTERLAGRLAMLPPELLDVIRPSALETLVKMGEIERAEQALAEIGEHGRENGHMAIGLAVLRLAQDDPAAAAAALAPILEDLTVVGQPATRVEALLLDAIARDALGDLSAATRTLERALDLAEPDGIVLPFLLHPVPELLDRHNGHRTAHGWLVAEILARLRTTGKLSPAFAEAQSLHESITEAELRVLRYLPTNLSQGGIASELGLSVHTIKTQVEQIYAKLDVHRRSEAVERARSLGLLRTPES